MEILIEIVGRGPRVLIVIVASMLAPISVVVVVVAVVVRAMLVCKDLVVVHRLMVIKVILGGKGPSQSRLRETYPATTRVRLHCWARHTLSLSSN